MGDSEEIRNLIGRYSHVLDGKRYTDLAEITTPDVVFDVLGDVVRGADAIAAFFASRDVPDRVGKHMTTNIVVDVDGDRATAATDFVYMGREGDGPLQAMGAGRYQDTFERRNGQWLFTARVIRR